MSVSHGSKCLEDAQSEKQSAEGAAHLRAQMQEANNTAACCVQEVNTLTAQLSSSHAHNAALSSEIKLQTHCQAFQQQFESPQSQLTQPQTHCHQLQEQLCPPPPPTPAPAVPDLTSDLSRVQRHLDAAAANKLQLQTQNASLQQKLSSAQVHFSLLQQQQQQMLDCTFFGMNWTAPNGQTGMGEADSSGANALKAQLGGAQMQMQADMQAVQSVLVLRTHQAEALQAKIELLRPMAHVTHSEWVQLSIPGRVLGQGANAALTLMHAQARPIVHLDLHVANVMVSLDGSTCKIIHLGCAHPTMSAASNQFNRVHRLICGLSVDSPELAKTFLHTGGYAPSPCMDMGALGQLGLRLSGGGGSPAQHASILDSVQYECDCFHADPANVPGSTVNLQYLADSHST
ncbi:hypothetical protein WJX77_001871 [Trebouxia sp. C0004]